MNPKPLVCLVLATALMAAGHGGAWAQAADPAPEVAPQQPAPETTIPEQVYPCNPGSYEPPAGLDEDRAEQLVDCEDGVLAPPATGDEEVEVTPPDTGTTPVIPPDDVPQQEGDAEPN